MPNKAIEKLEEKYYRTCNAIERYRHKNGYNPGARVTVRYMDGTDNTGVIAPYGDAWTNSGINVPIMLDNGGLQLHVITNLTIDKNPTAMTANTTGTGLMDA